MALLFSTESPIVPGVSLTSTGGSPPPYISQRSELKRIAIETLDVLKTGSYTVQTTRGDVDYDLRRKIREMRQRTRFYHPNDPKIIRGAASLSTIPKEHSDEGSILTASNSQSFVFDDDDSDGLRGQGTPAYISVFPGTTVEAVASLILADVDAPTVVGPIGVLSSGCAVHPGGNLRGGSKGQELSLARASTLYASLTTAEAKKLYDLKTLPTMNTRHTVPNSPGADPVLNTHGMIYTPGVTIFRDDFGQYIPPMDIDILTCAAVPAQAVRAKYGPANTNTNATANGSSLRPRAVQPLDARQVEVLIQRTMRERMARILFLFARRGVRSLVLPAFGTGTFGNSPAVVARLWARLLTAPDVPFARLFDRVVFSVLPGPACDEFERVFGRDGASSFRDAFSIGPVPSSGASARPAHAATTPVTEDQELPKSSNLEQYARALGLPGGSRNAEGDGSSPTEKGKGKQRATCEDADDDDASGFATPESAED